MRTLIILSVLVAAVAGQGLFGGLSNPLGQTVGQVVGQTVGQTVGRLPFASQLPSIANLPLPGTIGNFADFVSKTGRQYASRAEQTLRENIFNNRNSLVDSRNSLFASGKSAFETGLNFLSDLKLEEILLGLAGRKKSAKGDSKLKNRKLSAPPEVAIPDSFDWRENGGVTPVKFQGLKCGACWSFAVTGAIEGHHFRKTKQLVNLSEQQLVDCSADYGNTGCDGGYHDYGFQYVIDNKGISKAELYPYMEKGDKCQFDPNNIGATIQEFASIPAGNETMIKQVVATLGPVSASVSAAHDTFVLYKDGIYDDDECNKGEVDHEILIVGYGSEDGRDYWIIKNSWTDKWGDKGYMKLPRNSNSFCGIASEASYPIV